MRESIIQFIEIVSETLPVPEPVFEFGSLRVPGQEDFTDMRTFFDGKKYVGCDMREGPGVDRILNLHRIDLESESIGTALIIDTLEHVEFPRKAIEETHRILRADGILVITSVMNFVIHSFPYDYWRFTPDGFKSLLRPFATSLVDYAGEEVFPHTVVGIGFKSEISEDTLHEFTKRSEHWKEKWFNPYGSSSWRRLVKSFIPPIFLNISRRY
jgi:SAM-dependent methyltransferase